MKIESGRGTGLGAGALFYARDTGRFLFVKRSEDCDYPNVWCGLGGGVEPGEALEQAVRREVWEEARHKFDSPLVPMHQDVQNDFTFHNYLAPIDTEFEPVLNDEHTEHMWSDSIPEPVHPGLMRSINAFEEKMKNGIA